MYAVIRKYDIIPGTMEELIWHVRESLVPILSRVPGLQAYYVVEVEGDKVAAISIFDTLADAKAAAQQTAGWVAEANMLFFQGESEAIAGQVRVPGEPVGVSPISQEELLQGSF